MDGELGNDLRPVGFFTPSESMFRIAPEDGSEFSGWWFGDSVGGQQVWSRSVETGKGKVRSSELADHG